MSIKQRLRKEIDRASLRNIMCAALLLILITGGVIAAGRWKAAAGGGVNVPVLSSANQQSTPAETVSLVMGTRAFTPASTTRATGPFRLEVVNQSGMQSFTLQLRRDNGGSLVQEWNVQVGAGQVWSADIDLPQGGYNLSVAENPACLFHITVQ
jgi:hypothetical protein